MPRPTQGPALPRSFAFVLAQPGSRSLASLNHYCVRSGLVTNAGCSPIGTPVSRLTNHFRPARIGYAEAGPRCNAAIAHGDAMQRGSARRNRSALHPPSRCLCGLPAPFSARASTGGISSRIESGHHFEATRSISGDGRPAVHELIDRQHPTLLLRDSIWVLRRRYPYPPGPFSAGVTYTSR